MSLQRLLVPLSQPEAVHGRLGMACAIARSFGAHIDVLHVRPDPQEAVPLLGEGVSGAMIDDLMTITDREGHHRAAAVRAAFDSARIALDLPLVERPNPDRVTAERPSVAWTEVVGREDDEIVRQAHLADLIVLARPDDDGSPSAPTCLNAALFESGRPVLVAPPLPAGVDKTAAAGGGLPVVEPGRHVAVAWNASTESTRALTAAMPFLVRADLVLVLSAGADAEPVGPVIDYLALHGVSARAGAAPVDSHHVGATLLDTATAAGADLMVMGAYSHGRIYEMIVGGATRHVLDNAAIPLLMAH